MILNKTIYKNAVFLNFIEFTITCARAKEAQFDNTWSHQMQITSEINNLNLRKDIFY